MAKRSKYNSVIDGKTFVQGQIYADAEVKGLPADDFEDVIEDEKKEEKPKTKAKVKAKEVLE